MGLRRGGGWYHPRPSLPSRLLSAQNRLQTAETMPSGRMAVNLLSLAPVETLSKRRSCRRIVALNIDKRDVNGDINGSVLKAT